MGLSLVQSRVLLGLDALQVTVEVHMANGLPSFTLVGLADVIVDLVSTGNTLKANRLLAVEEIMPISSRLVVNQAALKLKREALQPVIEAIAAAVGKRG